MKDIKELNIKEMEMVNGGEAMEACDACDVIEEAEVFDACDALGYDNYGRLCKRERRFRYIKINGVMKQVPYFVLIPVEEDK